MDEFISSLNNIILKYVTDAELYDFSELSAIDSFSILRDKYKKFIKRW